MSVDPKDCTCRQCDGELQIIEADDGTLTVVCTECGDCMTTCFVDESAHKWRAWGASGVILATASEEEELEDAVCNACDGEVPHYSIERVFSADELRFPPRP